VAIDSGASGNTVGGTTAAARNVLSANGGRGIEVDGPGNFVQGNYIGTDITASLALGNGSDGVWVAGSDNLIGGTTPGAGNVVSANAGTGGFGGITIVAPGNTVQGNLVGTDSTGTRVIDPNGRALGNANAGVSVGSDPSVTNNLIGGTAPGAGNVIAGTVPRSPGNQAAGVVLVNSSDSTVQGNFIGTDRTGTLRLGN
jgi:titin